ncbi:hypothetical protein FRC98_20735, partial [Lujinxingia vulgaris]
TGYEAEEIEVDYELEADLGVDTVKQAEIMAQVRELYGLERDESFRLSEYPTLRRMGDYVAERVGMMGDGAVPGHRAAAVPGSRAAEVLGSRAAEVPGHRADEVPGHRADVVSGDATSPAVDRASIDAELLRVLCEQTGYEAEEIEVDYELEADLGVDTVKQAEIMAQVRELYGLERDESFRLSEYPTLRRMGDYVAERVGMAGVVPGHRADVVPGTCADGRAAAVPGHRAAAVPGHRADEVPGSRAAEVPGHRAAEVPGHRADAVRGDATSSSVDRASIDAELMRVLCEQTGYEAEEIEVDYELEADLGVDTVKQAEIMAQVRELYGLKRDESFRLSEYPTLRRMGDYVAERVGMMGDGAVPGHRADAVPGHRADEVPGHRADEVPGSRADEVPGSRADRVPGSRADEVPGSRADEAPGHRADVVSRDATSPAVDRASIDAELMRVLCEQTGYEAEEIEVDYELEADLGVDTVKQAEIMAQVRELYGL